MDTATAASTRTQGHDAGHRAEPAGSGPGRSRRARHLAQRRRVRRRLAAGMAVAGVIAIVAGLAWRPGGDGGSGQPEPVTVSEGGVTQNTAKTPTTGPGGVGENPEKTGLPAREPGGRVRTGTEEEGCFASMREYLDAWDRTGQEPDPCFLPQAPAEQPQPDGVVRSYNGEQF